MQSCTRQSDVAQVAHAGVAHRNLKPEALRTFEHSGERVSTDSGSLPDLALSGLRLALATCFESVCMAVCMRLWCCACMLPRLFDVRACVAEVV